MTENNKTDYTTSRSKKKRRKSRHALRKTLVFLLFICAIAALVYWGNSAIHTDVVEVKIEGLAGEYDGLRIIQLSDLHGRQFGQDNEILLEAVRNAKPDIIAITGDLVDEQSDMAFLPKFTQALAEIAPVYYVTGNHEWAIHLEDSIDGMLSKSGITILHNSFSAIEGANGGVFILAGIDDPNGPADMETPAQLIDRIRQSWSSAPIILLAHRNTPSIYEDLDVSLVLCGHGHGGIIRLPFLGGLLGQDRTLFPDFTSGLYDLDGVQMFVSRGLGGTKYELRIGNRPHLPVIILRSK